MIGNKHGLDVYLGKNKIAKLVLNGEQLFWEYSKSWQQSGFPVSPYMPLDGEIPTLNVQRFLRNLLPEGNGFAELVNCYHLSQFNTFGLIRALGLDTPGSLVLLPLSQPLPKTVSFRTISNDELEQRLNGREEFSLIIWDGKPRLSVAGIQDKINVVLNQDEQLGFGEGMLCSTHILKFEKQKLAHLVLNEYISMKLAKESGLNVANVTLKCFGRHRALLIERFDRHFISMYEVKRRHIIDGCQALNLPPEYKYERNFGSAKDVKHIRDGASLPKLFAFANQCANPALTTQQMLDWVLFNLLIFNSDAHGKNISFFIGFKGIELAPFYDLVNIKMYPDFEHELAMALGDEFDDNAIGAYQLADFADSCNLSRQLLVKRLKYLINNISRSLDRLINEIDCNHEERSYLDKYRHLVTIRCEHFLEQANDVVSIDL